MGSADYRLIELIRQNKHLYDQNDPDFRNLDKKEITWRAIAAAQGSTPEICRRRFRSLRDRFAKEKRFRKKDLLDGNASNPIWLRMMFLWDHLRPRRRFNWNRPDQHKRSEPNDYESSDQDVDSPEQRLENIEELNEGQSLSLHQVEESVSEATFRQETTENYRSPTKRINRYRPIQPKPDSQRNNPIIVNLVPKVSKKCGNRDSRGTSEAESDGWGETQEIDEKSRDDRGRALMSTSTTTVRHSSQNRTHDASSISSNDAFCMMLKESLDQVTNPLKLSLLRIKIMTILHNEVHG